MIIAELIRHEQFVNFFEEVCDSVFIKDNGEFYDKLGRLFFEHFNSHINIFEVIHSRICCCHYTSDPCFQVGQVYTIDELDKISGKQLRQINIFDQLVAIIQVSNNENDKIFDNVLGLLISYRNYNSKDLLITYNIYKKFQNYAQELVLISKEMYKHNVNDKSTVSLIKQLQANVSNLLAMMNDLFDYKLLDYRKMVINSNVTNLAVLDAFLKKVILGKEDDVQLLISPDKSNFKLDEQRFFQIIMNVLSSGSSMNVSSNSSAAEKNKIVIRLSLQTEKGTLELNIKNLKHIGPLQQITQNHEYVLHYLKDSKFDVSFLLTFMVATKLIKVMGGSVEMNESTNSLVVRLPVEMLKRDILSNTKVMVFNFRGTRDEKLLLKRFFIMRSAFLCFADMEDYKILFDVPGEWENTSMVIVHYPKRQNRVLINEAIEHIQSRPELKDSKFICYNDSGNEVQLSLKFDYIITSLSELQEVFGE